MRAYFKIGDVTYPLTKVSVETMDGFFEEEGTKALVAYPNYFDAKKRVWPNVPDGVTVQFDG